MKKEKVYELALTIAKNIAKLKKGTLIVIGPKNKFRGAYERLYPQLISNYNIKEKGIKIVLEKLATLDGAILLSDSGEILAYGAKIKKSKPVLGHGTKHAAASGITNYIKNSTAILVSEEINWIRVFQNGKIIMEMDPQTMESSTTLNHKIASFLSDKNTALLTATGISAAVLGLAPTLIIGGTYLTVKTATGIIKRHLKY